MSAFAPEALGRLRSAMNGYVDRGEIPGIVVAGSCGDETFVEPFGSTAFDSSTPVRRDTIFRVASMSKPVAAVAAMILVEECRLRLDDPVDRYLPELADRRVMRQPDGSLADTVPADRPITLRDLLTLRMGIGYRFDLPQDCPYLAALRELAILQGPPRPLSTPDPDEWIRRVGTLPLMAQPGTRWLYDLGLEILSVLIARAAEQPLDRFLEERIFRPLGMKDTAFFVSEDRMPRFVTSYWNDFATGEMKVFDPAVGGQWSRPPTFPSGAGGLVSTADDFLAFGRMMLNLGKRGSERIVSPATVELMTTDQLTPEHRIGTQMFLGDDRNWGLGMSLTIRRTNLWSSPGRYGWDGGLGSSWYCDPSKNLVGVLLTQRAWTSPVLPPVCQDFWTCTYSALEG